MESEEVVPREREERLQEIMDERRKKKETVNGKGENAKNMENRGN